MKMKRFFIALAALVMTAGIASAQDLSMATETFNNAVTTAESDKAAALGLFQQAMTLGQTCGEEGAEIVKNCKDVIPGLILSIAKGQINDGQYDAALASLKDAAAKAGEYGIEGIAEEAESLVPDVFFRKGTALFKAKDMAGAAEAFQQVVAADTTNGAAYLRLGQSLLMSGNADGAVEALGQASAKGQKENADKLLGNIFLKKGMGLLKGGKNAEAIEALTKANEYTDNPASYKLIASAYTKLGKTSNALDAYKKYLELDPDAKDASGVKLTIAATAQKHGDKATAIEYYKQLVGDAQYGETAKQQLGVLQK